MRKLLEMLTGGLMAAVCLVLLVAVLLGIGWALHVTLGL